MVRWPLQPLQPGQKTQLQTPVGPSVDSLCHPWFTTTNLSYRFPIFELPPPPCAVLLANLKVASRERHDNKARDRKQRWGGSFRASEKRKWERCGTIWSHPWPRKHAISILGKSGKSAIVVVVVDDKVVVPWKAVDPHATQRCKLCDAEKDSNKPRSSLEDIHAVKRDRTSVSTLP